MRKNFVLDTNVLLHDPDALTSFDDNNIIIPIYVVEEVDAFKKDLSELGRNARQISRRLDEMRAKGRLVDGVPLNGNPEGGQLRVAFAMQDLPSKYALSGHTADNRILSTALEVQKADPNTPLVFISKDINLRIRGASLGLEVQDYSVERRDISELHSGILDITVDMDSLNKLFSDGELPLASRGETDADGHRFGDHQFYPNTFAIVRSEGSQGTALVRLRTDEEKMVLLKGNGPTVWGIRPRNKEQRLAFELLMDDNIRLVTLVGQAGTGKTLLALAAGLQKVVEEHAYQKLLVSRPIFPLGRDIGFLPGDVDEKLRPWMQPVHDNLELLLGMGAGEASRGRSTNEVFDMDLVHIEPLTYIRGRSIPKQFILVDEAQNLTPHEVKTIITRVGEETKIVLTGDPYQIDNPYVDATNNGLVHVVNRFLHEPLAGHITLAKGERSNLAERAANLL